MEMPQMDNNNENEITQTENSEQAVKTADILKLLKKLTELQAQSTVVKAGKAVKIVENSLEGKVNELKKYIEAGEKKYRPRNSDAKKIEKEYLDLVNQVNDILKQDIAIPAALKNKYEGLECIEVQKIANYQMAKARYKEIKRDIKNTENSSSYKKYDEMISLTRQVLQTAIKSGDTTTIEQYNNELKHLQQKQTEMFEGKKEQADAKKQELLDLKTKVKPAKEELKTIRSEIKKQAEYIKKSRETAAKAVVLGENNKDKQLVALKKRSAIFKVFDSFRSIIGGDKKFSENIIEPIKREIETIKREKIPELQAGVYARLAEEELKLKQFEEKAISIATKGKDNIIETKDKIITGAKTVGKTSVEVAKTVGRTSTEVVKTVGKKGAELGLAAGGIVVGGIYIAGTGVKNTIVNVANAGKEKKENFLKKMANKLQTKIDSYSKSEQSKSEVDRDEK